MDAGTLERYIAVAERNAKLNPTYNVYRDDIVSNHSQIILPLYMKILSLWATTYHPTKNPIAFNALPEEDKQTVNNHITGTGPCKDLGDVRNLLSWISRLQKSELAFHNHEEVRTTFMREVNDIHSNKYFNVNDKLQEALKQPDRNLQISTFIGAIMNHFQAFATDTTYLSDERAEKFDKDPKTLLYLILNNFHGNERDHLKKILEGTLVNNQPVTIKEFYSFYINIVVPKLLDLTGAINIWLDSQSKPNSKDSHHSEKPPLGHTSTKVQQHTSTGERHHMNNKGSSRPPSNERSTNERSTKEPPSPMKGATKCPPPKDDEPATKKAPILVCLNCYMDGHETTKCRNKPPFYCKHCGPGNDGKGVVANHITKGHHNKDNNKGFL